MNNGIPIEEFWEKDNGVSMDGLIRIERFIKSQGTKSAQIWGAWYDLKRFVKAAIKYAETYDSQTKHQINTTPIVGDGANLTGCSPMTRREQF
jgi:hypothetical protein